MSFNDAGLKKLFGTNGVRGIVNKELTAELVVELTKATAAYFKEGPILTGCDGRVSSLAFLGIVNSILNLCGLSVVTLGQAPTPAIQFTTKRKDMRGAVVVTASHNPPEYNGIKVIGGDGIEVPRDAEAEIEGLLASRAWRTAEWSHVASTHRLEDWLSEYKASVVGVVEAPKIQRRALRVVVDAANGVGALSTPYILRELGCKVIAINSHVDGTFPSRDPEPRLDNLDQLAKAVVAFKADFGVAHDGDADRAIFVDEKGTVHWGDKTLALIAQHVLSRQAGGIVVTPISTSGVVKEIVEALGGRVEWTKVGSVYVSHTMEALQAALGGEENGGVCYRPHMAVRDGAMAAALIAEALADSGRPLSELIAALPVYYTFKEKVACPHGLKAKVMASVLEAAKGLEVDTTDGVKVWFEDGSWVLVRPSGTEPLIRVIAEAKSEGKASRLALEHKEKIAKLVKEAAR